MTTDEADSRSRMLFFLKRKDWQGVIDQCQRMLAQNPGLVVCHTLIGSSLTMLNRLDEAVQAYEAALRIEPHAAAYSGLASVFQRLGEPARAIEQLRRAVD